MRPDYASLDNVAVVLVAAADDDNDDVDTYIEGTGKRFLRVLKNSINSKSFLDVSLFSTFMHVKM